MDLRMENRVEDEMNGTARSVGDWIWVYSAFGTMGRRRIQSLRRDNNTKLVIG